MFTQSEALAIANAALLRIQMDLSALSRHTTVDATDSQNLYEVCTKLYKSGLITLNTLEQVSLDYHKLCGLTQG